MGVGYKGAFDLFPKEIGGNSVTYIVRDYGTDPNTAFTIAQKLISEDHVDALIGPSLTASDAAVQPLANSAHVPMIAMAPRARQPAARLLSTLPGRGTRHRPGHEPRARDLSATGPVSEPACRYAIRRRAADAGARPRADGAPTPAAAR